MCVGMYVCVRKCVCMCVRERGCLRGCVCAKRINAMPFDSSIAGFVGIRHSDIAPVMCVGMCVCEREYVYVCV